MKLFYLTLVAILAISKLSYAQWTTQTGTSNYYLSSGNAGIGTTTPSYRLNVDPQGSGGILLGNSNTNSGNYTSMILSISQEQNGYSSIQSIKSAGASYGNLILNPSGGNIGIGTAFPSNLLHLYATTTAPLLNIQNTSPDGYNEISYTGTGNSYHLGVGNGAETVFGVANSWYIYDVNSGKMRMIINPNGNVLIGEPSQKNASYILDVGGTERVNGIVVNATGADFVFEPTYKLFSLPKLKEYIDQNHHLPEIPSAKEMQTDGLNLGENQTKLLQKVEELTLYMIDKDEELNNEKGINVKQQTEIDTQIQTNRQLSDRVKLQQQQIDLLTKQVTQLLKNK